MSESKKWYQTARRWLQLNFTEDICQDNHLEEWREYWRKGNYDGVIISTGSFIRYFQSEYDYQKKARWLEDQDIVRDYCKALKEDGLHIVGRMDLECASLEYAKTHPDWFVRDRDGNIDTNLHIQGSNFSGLGRTCIVGEYYKKVVPELLKEMITKYHIDGFSDNSWKGTRKNNICYCENCRKNFLEEEGLDLPKKVDWEDPIYRKWIRWSYRKRVELWDHLDSTARRYGGEDCLWAGMFHADPHNRLNEFINFHEISKRVRVLFLDHQCRDLGNGMDMEQNSANGSMFHLLCGEDKLLIEAIATHARCNDWRIHRASVCSPAENSMWVLEGIAGGLSPWTHFIGVHNYDRRRLELDKEIMSWHKANEKYLYDRQEIADVGVIWSQENADFYGRDQTQTRVAQAAFGVRHALMKEGIPFLYINVHDIAKYGRKVKTLVFPNIAVLGEEDEDVLIEYIENGGNIVTFGETALLDDLGYPKQHKKLWDYLQIEVTGMRSVNGDEDVRTSYFRIQDHEHPMMAGFEQCDLVPCGSRIVKMHSKGDIKPLASWVPMIPAFPPELSYLHEEEPDSMTLFAGKIKNDSKVVVFAADVDRSYGRDELPDYKRLIINAINYTLDEEKSVYIEVTGNVDIKAYKQENHLLIHLVNITGSSPGYGFVDEFVPVGPVKVHLRSGDAGEIKAFGRVTMKEYPVIREGQEIIICVGRVVKHELLVIDKVNMIS